jgi:hypothetical protein
MGNSDNTQRPVAVIRVLCDVHRMQRIAITCRCGRRWVEPIPGELHESSLRARFTCIQCGTEYDLHNKQLTRVTKEVTNGPEPTKQTADDASLQFEIGIDKRHYDS